MDETWPRLVNQNLKDKIVKMFREQASTDTLSTFTCSSCGKTTSRSLQQEILLPNLMLMFLNPSESDSYTHISSSLMYHAWLMFLYTRGQKDNVHLITYLKKKKNRVRPQNPRLSNDYHLDRY